jgi:hypothetical protein
MHDPKGSAKTAEAHLEYFCYICPLIFFALGIEVSKARKNNNWKIVARTQRKIMTGIAGQPRRRLSSLLTNMPSVGMRQLMIRKSAI